MNGKTENNKAGIETILQKRRKRILYLTQTGVLTAIIFIMAFIPAIGYPKIGIVSLTLMVIPVAVGAILMGPWVGAWLGFSFGVTSLIQCFTGDAFGAFLFGLNPFMTIVLCIVPRVLIGMVVGFVFKVFDKFILSKNKNRALSAPFCAVSSMIGALTNTVLFISFLALLFLPYMSEVEGFVGGAFWSFIIGLITFNSLIEVAVTLLIGGAIAYALREFLNKKVLHERVAKN